MKFLFAGLVSHVMGTCIDQDHPEYGDCVQHCETALSLCSSKCDGNTGCINDCEDEETACIGEYTYFKRHNLTFVYRYQTRKVRFRNCV